MWADSYIEKLKAGETVQFRPRGNSMEPLVKNGALVTVSPKIGFPSPGAIVLCKVSGAQYLHLIHSTEYEYGSGKSEYRVQISNNKGRINGWTSIKNVYGIVVAIEP
jgi:hypothetical protein